MRILLQTCCYAFTLQQGTILVAVIELLVSAIGLFLLLLGSAHAQEIAAMLEADIAENRGGRSYHLHSDDATVDVLPPFYYSNNEIRLHKGQYLALVMIMALYIAIAIVTVHLISCMLLLYGSIMRVRQCLMPWMSVVVLEVVVVLSSFFFFIILGRGTAAILLVTVLFVLLHLPPFATMIRQLQSLCPGLCLLLAVFSYYRQLFADQVSSCSSLVQQDANSIKAGYLQFPPTGKPSDV